MRARVDDSPVNSVRAALNSAEDVAAATAVSAAATTSAAAESVMGVGSDTRPEFTRGVSSVLVLGGTGWLGRELVRAGLSAGDDVTCLARGESGAVPPGAEFVRSDRSAPDAYAAVADRDWDRVIELSWDHDFAVGALDALAERAVHWTLVSTISVYASNSTPGADESDPLLEPDDPDDYGKAKVAIEHASAAALGGRLLIVRPGLIAGPGDPSDRFGYWGARLALAGSDNVLSMEVQDRTAQIIDVRDLAEFAVASGGVGILNAVGTSVPLASAIELASTACGFSGRLVVVDDEWLLAHDVRYWAGPRSLPLWLPLEDAAMTTRSNAAYLAAGGGLRPFDETVRDVLADEVERGVDRERRAGLTRAEELQLLDEIRH
jgi:nucleoside-diphosphate-sugar epimerase